MVFEVELAFEGVVDRLDHLPQRPEQPSSRARCLTGAGRAQQRDALAGERGFELSAATGENLLNLVQPRPHRALAMRCSQGIGRSAMVRTGAAAAIAPIRCGHSRTRRTLLPGLEQGDAPFAFGA